MADVLATGQGLRDQEIVIERLDGARIVALVNIEAITDSFGRVVGAVNVFQEKPAQLSGQLRLNGHERLSAFGHIDMLDCTAITSRYRTSIDQQPVSQEVDRSGLKAPLT